MEVVVAEAVDMEVERWVVVEAVTAAWVSLPFLQYLNTY